MFTQRQTCARKRPQAGGMSVSRSRGVVENAAQADAWYAGLRPAVGKTQARLFWRYASGDRNTDAQGLASKQSWFRTPSCSENYQFSATKTRDRCRVPEGAWAGPPLSPGMPVPHDRGPFRLRALLYCVELGHTGNDCPRVESAARKTKRMKMGRTRFTIRSMGRATVPAPASGHSTRPGARVPDSLGGAKRLSSVQGSGLG